MPGAAFSQEPQAVPQKGSEGETAMTRNNTLVTGAIAGAAIGLLYAMIQSAHAHDLGYPWILFFLIVLWLLSVLSAVILGKWRRTSS
jgi:hypothetical protein